MHRTGKFFCTSVNDFFRRYLTTYKLQVTNRVTVAQRFRVIGYFFLLPTLIFRYGILNTSISMTYLIESIEIHRIGKRNVTEIVDIRVRVLSLIVPYYIITSVAYFVCVCSSNVTRSTDWSHVLEMLSSGKWSLELGACNPRSTRLVSRIPFVVPLVVRYFLLHGE